MPVRTFELIDQIFHHEPSRSLEQYKLWNGPEDHLWITRGKSTPSLAGTRLIPAPRPMVPSGRRRHFKGRYYLVAGLARFIGESEWYVVYVQFGNGWSRIFFRLASEFNDMVKRNGQKPVKRFAATHH